MQREKWRSELMEIASQIALSGVAPLPQALMMSAGLASDFFQGKAFEDWRKRRDAEAKLGVATVERLNEVIRGVGVLAKVMAGRS